MTAPHPMPTRLIAGRLPRDGLIAGERQGRLGANVARIPVAAVEGIAQ